MKTQIKLKHTALILTGLCLFFFTFSACNKDDDTKINSTSAGTKKNDDGNNGGNNNGKILGKWFGTHWEVGGEGEMSPGSQFKYTMIATELDVHPYEVDFHSDGFVTSTRDSFKVDVTMEFGGQKQVTQSNTSFSMDSAKWNRQGDTLYIILPEEPGVIYPYYIKTLNSTTLALELYKLPSEINDDMGGDNMTGYVKMGMKR